jgi:hypothetical protein
MKPRWHAYAWLCLPLLAACERNIYVGRDAPAALRTESVDAGVAPTEAPVTEPLDAGAAPPPLPPTITTMTTMPAQMIGQPAPPSCEAGHADCDLDASNGCEADLMHDRNHCGACATACQTPDCVCNDGKLALQCDDKHADCDADLSNGCETDLMTSMQHCGACQRTCHTNGHDVTSAMCTDGRCHVTCAPRISPEEDCDGNPDNGCESYLMFDNKNCGACGVVCATACEAGTCML